MIFVAYLVQDSHISSGPLRDLMVAAQQGATVGQSARYTATLPLSSTLEARKVMSASEIMDLLKQTQAVAEEKFGITNILQPGVIKELIMAEILGHGLVPQKDLPDA
jgi:hypothetical protein